MRHKLKLIHIVIVVIMKLMALNRFFEDEAMSIDNNEPYNC